MPKRQNDYSPGQYRNLTKIKELLIPYTSFCDVIVDQKDSYYLAFPNDSKHGDLAGGMFAAVQIMDTTVDLIIKALMNNRDLFTEDVLREVEGIIDPKGVLHIYFVNRKLKDALKTIFDFSAKQLEQP
ncbi:MAG: hypothetical protein LBF27_14080 [Sphingobacterium sp.]|jgi:hypothetical protein|nr:hypothetical protein [Sphingobacterium sp.]